MAGLPNAPRCLSFFPLKINSLVNHAAIGEQQQVIKEVEDLRWWLKGMVPWEKQQDQMYRGSGSS